MTRLYSLLLTMLCVLFIAFGQVLFKMAAIRSQVDSDASALERWFNLPLLFALIIYGVATLLWIWILRSVALNIAYPLFALAFLIVPLLAYFFLNEPLSVRQLIGGAIVVIGVAISYA